MPYVSIRVMAFLNRQRSPLNLIEDTVKIVLAIVIIVYTRTHSIRWRHSNIYILRCLVIEPEKTYSMEIREGV